MDEIRVIWLFPWFGAKVSSSAPYLGGERRWKRIAIKGNTELEVQLVLWWYPSLLGGNHARRARLPGFLFLYARICHLNWTERGT